MNLRRILVWKEQVDAIMNRYNQVRCGEKWRFVVRNMYHIHTLPLQRQRNECIVSPKALLFGLIQLREVAGERPKLVKVAMRSDQEIVILRVYCGDIAHQIPNVGA